MSKKYKNLIYFQNGSIGDFLMTIFFLENVYLNDDSIKLYIVVPKNKVFLSQFLKKYSYINLILANRKNIHGWLGIFSLFKFSFYKNLIITVPTPGRLPLGIKIIAKLTAMHFKSLLAGSDDGQGINKLIYNKLYKYNKQINYPECLKSILKILDFEIKKENPILEHADESNILEQLKLEKNNYVVIHARAATKGRSLDNQCLRLLVNSIISIDGEMKILLTGSTSDRDFLSGFESEFKNVVLGINLSVVDLCGVIKKSKLFIGVDTGITHVASFLGKKSLVLAQSGTPNWLPYYNDQAIILYAINDCTYNIYSGQEYLQNCQKDDICRLGKIPFDVINQELKKLL